MEDKIFVIKDLGIFEFVVSLVYFDYPVVFVAKKTCENNIELYLFDEIDNCDNSVSWAMTQISYEQLNLLNKGMIKLSECFISERGLPKPGYKIISESGFEKATKIDVKDIRTIINHRLDYYVEPFTSNDHGIGLLSLVYGTKIMGLIVDKSKYASPIINGTYVENIIRDSKSYVRSLSTRLDIKGYSFATNNSIVLSIELGVKEQKKDKINVALFGDFDAQKEVDDFINVFKKSVSPDSDDGEIISDYYGNIQPIKKMTNLISSIKNANPKGDIHICFSDTNGSKRSIDQITINKNVVKEIKKRNERIIKTINNSDNNETTTEIMCGVFEMFDASKNNGRFIFVDNQTKNIYKGISTIDLDFIKNSNFSMKLFNNYNVEISKTIYKIQNKNSKPVYKLIKIELAVNSEQTCFDFDK